MTTGIECASVRLAVEIPEPLRAAIHQHVRNTVRTAVNNRLAELKQAPRAADLLADAMTPVTIYPHGMECRVPEELAFLCTNPAPGRLQTRRTADPGFVVVPFSDSLTVPQAMKLTRYLKATAIGFRHSGASNGHSEGESPSGFPDGYAAACVYVAGVLGDSARRLCVYDHTGRRHALFNERSPGWTLHVMEQVHTVMDAAWNGDAWETETTLWGRA